MPIFDDFRGLVPLPRSGSGNLNDETEGVFTPSIPIPLPGNNPLGFDGSNTVIDQVYSGIADVFHSINLPTPDVITNLYKETQAIENIVQNPVDFLRNKARESIYDSLHPTDPNLIPVDQSSSFKKSEDSSTLLETDDGITFSTSGSVREALVQTDPKSYERIQRLSESTPSDGSPELYREFTGRDSVKDLSLRSVDLWDFKIDALEYNGVKNTWVPPFQQADNSFVNGANPYADIIPLTDPSITDYIPILSYNLDLKTLTTKTINLYGGSTIQVPELIRYNSQLNFQLIDDENKRWRRWLQTYSENLCNEEENTVAPYKNSSLLVTLVQYRQDHRILAYNQYICALANYQMISLGAESGGVDIIDVELSIVGKIELPSTFNYLEIV